jgi:hypothetical protein
MILGLDFLRKHNCQLHLGEGTLTMGNKKMSCNQNGEENSYGLLVAKCLVEPKNGKAPSHAMNVCDKDKGTSSNRKQHVIY